MAAPMIIGNLRRVCRFQLLKSALPTSGRIDGQYHRCLIVVPDKYMPAQNGQHRLNSHSADNSTGKAPLKKPYTPVGKHDDTADRHKDAEKEPLEAFPDDINPATGEKGGPRGPEPTRYGDWERKGRCIDF